MTDHHVKYKPGLYAVKLTHISEETADGRGGRGGYRTAADADAEFSDDDGFIESEHDDDDGEPEEENSDGAGDSQDEADIDHDR